MAQNKSCGLMIAVYVGITLFWLWYWNRRIDQGQLAQEEVNDGL